MIALTVGGFIIFSIISSPPAQDGLASATTTTSANTAAPTTIEEVLNVAYIEEVLEDVGA